VSDSNIEVVRRAYDAMQRRDLDEEAGDAVLVTGNSLVRGAGSGLEMTVEWGQVFRLRDGKVLWSRIYPDPAEAREEFQTSST
jgi:ketosteroid isomerase-like protein